MVDGAALLASGARTHAEHDRLMAGVHRRAAGPGQREKERESKGRGSVLEKQTGRGLCRQLEGIRVSDKDLSDAAVAAAD